LSFSSSIYPPYSISSAEVCHLLLQVKRWDFICKRLPKGQLRDEYPGLIEYASLVSEVQQQNSVLDRERVEKAYVVAPGQFLRLPPALQTELVARGRIPGTRIVDGQVVSTAEPSQPVTTAQDQPAQNFPELKTFEFEYPVISFEEETQEETEILADTFDPALPTFDFETVRVNAEGRIIERIQGEARYFKESLVENILSSALRPASVFMVYSYRDESLKDELSVHLADLRRQGVIDPWHLHAIEAEDEWDSTLRRQIESVQIVLLLVSPNLLASDFVYDVELRRILERHSQGVTRVIPIILSPGNWQNAPFAKLQVLPKDGRPITEWENRDDAFRSVTQGIRFVAEQIQKDHQGVSLDMVAIPGGTFLMGSPNDEIGHRESEAPQHEVTVQPFFMSKTPITQAQWRAVAELDPVNRELEPDPARFKGDDRPVEKVSWLDATEFCARLSRLTGRDYRLPTEAEWEYACRAMPSPPAPLPELIL
jgi:hypothetical protein